MSDRHEIILPNRSEFTKSKEIIMGCNLMVAEVSYPSTGLGIELGWAEEFNTDVVYIHRREEKPSKAIQVVTWGAESYRDEDEIINVIADNI